MADPTPDRVVNLEFRGGPHNGEGRPDLQFPDPVTGERIGGQVAAIRMAMRYRHVVCPWARRQGKTRFREFLYTNEAAITTGTYYAGIVYPDHTTAAKVADVFRSSWGGLVRDFKVNDKDQDRWIELHPIIPPSDTPPAWFTPPLAERWRRCRKGERNTGSRIYFWGGAHPHYEKIQGFPHPFHRVDWDEAQQIHPLAYGIVRPMIRDVLGHECFSGTPWDQGIGNVKFEQFWDIAGDPTSAGWFRMRIPDGASPHVPPTPLEEARRSMTQAEIDQTLFAKFLSDQGAVFSGLDRVFILKPLEDSSPALDWLRALRSRYALASMEWYVHQPKPIPGHIYLASIDWARSPRGDWSVLTVVDATTGQQALVIRFRGEEFPEQMEVVVAVTHHYGAGQCHADANGMGEAMADFLRRRKGISFVGHKFGKNKASYVRQLQVLIRDADVALIDCLAQRREFKNFTAHESESLSSERQITYAAPVGENDDCVAALLHLAPTLAIVGRQATPPPEPEPVPLISPEGTTTLDLWAEGGRVPWRDEEDGLSWESVVLPPKFR